MLAISRLAGQSILIGDHLLVTVEHVDEHSVALHVRGPAVGGPRHGLPLDRRHVLERDEVAVCGSDVRVTVVDIQDDKTRLGIDAPESLPVHRKEVLDYFRDKQGRGDRDGDDPGCHTPR